MSIIPPYLSPGDTIGLICPSGYMPAENIETCYNTLKAWGYKVKVGSTVGHQFHYFSGTDERRLHDLQDMLDDDEVRAIFCARGGYGLTRIIDDLDFKKFRENPKWLVGYSDITLLHAHVYRRYKIASLHAPMAAAFNDGGHENQYVQSLRHALAGGKSNYACDPHPFNKSGAATGKLVGGNLSLLAHITGTRSQLKTKNKILFLEDVGEYLYNVDRMLYQLKRSGQLEDLAGLVIGGFTEMKDTTIPYGKNIYELIHELIKDYNYPVCFNFPVGHQKENYALKIGIEYFVSIEEPTVNLNEA